MEKKGEPIAGSRYLRSFCSECGDPMRVTADRVDDPRLVCRRCKPAINPRAGNGAKVTDDGGPDLDAHRPAWRNH